ncbi:hypothetical protein GGR50DRAFT_262588 [Xylaria sp. CBS 124048]|nr:hypothetical protein GGR50DRAFT_262588 [Xylaria sp. CBS 124048]
MADEDLVLKVRGLGDIELAALLCLVSREHCIISTDAEYLDDLTAELQLIAAQTFGLDAAVVDCTPETTLEDLVAAIQLPQRRKSTAASPPPPSSPRARGSVSTYVGADGSGNIGGIRTHSHLHHQHGAPRPSSSFSANVHVPPAAQSRTSLLSTGTQLQYQQRIANIVLARNLDTAPKDVQIQYLELMRTRRIFMRVTVQPCPKHFLLIAVLGSENAGRARLTKHLNNHFYISHWHDPEDGFARLDEGQDGSSDSDDTDRGYNDRRGSMRKQAGQGGGGDDDDDDSSPSSSASVVRRTPRSKTPSTPIPTPLLGTGPQIATTDWATQNQGSSPTTKRTRTLSHATITPLNRNPPLLTETDISTLATLSLQTHVDIEVQRYQMNIVAFLRMHRAVTPGSVPPPATAHFRTLLRALAALHGLEFATPELVQLAARKIYAHRIVIVSPERERSMQWGSDLDAVTAMLEGLQPEDVIEDVLGTVEVPI